MTTAESRTPPTATRSRGRRAGIDLERILEAARTLDPNDLTMQAVADRLGVDRKSVNHHVTDRETLVALVAREVFLENFAEVRIGENITWQEACRTYAIGLAESTIAAGSIADRLRLDESRAAVYLEPSEAVVSKLVGAGLDDETALRHLTLLTNISLSYARDVVLAAVRGERRRPAVVRTVIAESEPTQFPNLTRIAASAVDTYSPRQLEIGIDLFVRGVEDLLREFRQTSLKIV